MSRSAEVYFDASVLVALLTNDPLTRRADALMRTRTPVLVVSDFAAAEFASAIARRVRMGGDYVRRGAHRVFGFRPSQPAAETSSLKRPIHPSL